MPITSSPCFPNGDALICSSIVSRNLAKRLSRTLTNQSLRVCVCVRGGEVWESISACMQIAKDAPRQIAVMEIISSSTTDPLRRPAACQICQFKSSTMICLSRFFTQVQSYFAVWKAKDYEWGSICKRSRAIIDGGRVWNLASGIKVRVFLLFPPVETTATQLFHDVWFMRDNQKIIWFIVLSGVCFSHSLRCAFDRRFMCFSLWTVICHVVAL